MSRMDHHGKGEDDAAAAAFFQSVGGGSSSSLESTLSPSTWKTLYTHYNNIHNNDKSKRFLSRHHSTSATNPPPIRPTHDLWATNILSILWPTHGTFHLLHFAVGVVALLYLLPFIILKSGLDGQVKHELMQYMAWIIPVALLGLWLLWHWQTLTTQLLKRCEWMNPSVTSYKRLPMHVPLRLFTNVKSARVAACRPDLPAMVTTTKSSKEEGRLSLTPNVWRLDSPMPWQFQLFQTVEDAMEFRQSDNNHNIKDNKPWPSLPVPGHWVLEDCTTSKGNTFRHDDIPIYTNQKTPFRPCAPPFVPKENPTGLYKLVLSKEQWPKEWILEQEQKRKRHNAHHYSILLHGVESACFVYWNGRLIGYGQDSRLPSEFHIPNDILLDDDEDKAIVHIVVPKFTDGSYLELQDHWKFGGIHRSVEIVRRPASADIMDYHVITNHYGNIHVSVSLRESQVQLMMARTIRVRLFADEQLNADGSQQKLAVSELWSATQTVRGESVVEFHDMIPDVKPWTAETPNLYTLVIEQVDMDDQDQSESTIQCESCRIGFRNVTIDHHDGGGGIVTVNDRPITICGINRHEHDPDHGKVVSLERMMQDITTLKQNNFNAIRTSHYPTHSSFYRLCDYYGMYICDEANIETHGLKPMGRLAHDRGWANAFAERVSRMVQRDYNHACIVFWSLGNEAGRGRNLMLARQKLMELDSTRPVCYESGMSWSEGSGRSELTDLVCPMYPAVPKLQNLHERADEDRPIVLCEYSHAMNNSNGNLHLYWEKFWDPRYPRLQGGFIWDFIDQGLRKKTADGREFFAYGGDFGPKDTNNDRQFCINGMFSPEREPHPSVHEIKYLQQPVSVQAGARSTTVGLKIALDGTATLVNATDGDAVTTISVSNRYSFLDLAHLDWKWQLFCNISQYSIRTGSAKEEKGVLSFDMAKMSRHIRELEENHTNVQYFLNIVGFLKEDALWATAGHVLVRQQFPLSVDIYSVDTDGLSTQDAGSPLLTSMPSLHLKQDKYRIEISSGEKSLPFMAIGKITGAITALNWSKDGAFDDNVLGRNDVLANYTRATTDNDRGGLELILEHMLLSFAQPLVYYTRGFDFFSHYEHWKQGGLTQDQPPSIVCDNVTVNDENRERLTIVADCSVKIHSNAQTIMKQTTAYQVHRDGCIKVTHKIVPTKRLRDIPSLPRIGLSMELNPSLHSIQYFGRGPHENYPDRKTASPMGVYKTSPSNMGYDYIVPSENGNRCDCEWVAFSDKDNEGGMLILAPDNDKFHFSALLHSADELNRADHTSDLDGTRKDGASPIFVNIDHQLMGVGGDNSWLPCVYPEYLVKANKEYEYSLWLIPLARRVDKDEDIAVFANAMKNRLKQLDGDAK